MVSLLKIKKIFFIILALALTLLTGNVCYCSAENENTDINPGKEKFNPKDKKDDPKVKNQEKKEELIAEVTKPEKKDAGNNDYFNEEIKKKEEILNKIKNDNKNANDKLKNIYNTNISTIKNPNININTSERKERKKTGKRKKENHSTNPKIIGFCGLLAKPVSSFLWSLANSIYHFEKIELNKVYFFKYILCVGYRWQPGFMKKSGLFFDFNISAVSVIHSILYTIIRYRIFHNKTKGEVCQWKWVLANSLFYTIPNSFNFNLNIKIKDKYFAINFAGLIAGLIDKVLLSKSGIPQTLLNNDMEKRGNKENAKKRKEIDEDILKREKGNTKIKPKEEIKDLSEDKKVEEKNNNKYSEVNNINNENSGK